LWLMYLPLAAQGLQISSVSSWQIASTAFNTVRI
jgi:hypothetical protein